MEYSRRSFLRRAGIMTAGLSLSPAIIQAKENELKQYLYTGRNRSAAQFAEDEDFWSLISSMYTESPNTLNFNNGGVSPAPKVVQDHFIRNYRYANQHPSFGMWRQLDKDREAVRYDLAEIAGCSDEEIAINRNTTEALDNIIFGLNLKKGDEVVLCKQDYPNMINAWKQREMREGIKLVWLDLDLPTSDPDKITGEFVNAFTKKTRVVHITHVINWNGQVLPVRKIADEAKKRGIEVLVDGAHSFAHLDFRIPDLNCDYFGTSLHKWLSAPFGTGMIYVRKDKIKDVWPLMSAPDPRSDDIRKFEHLGTRSVPAEHAVGEAIRFHRMIGAERKEARFKYLRQFWIDEVKDLPGVSIGSPEQGPLSCGIGIIKIDGLSAGELGTMMYKKARIHTTSIVWENIEGMRISPHVYTLKPDLGKLVKAIKEIQQEQVN